MVQVALVFKLAGEHPLLSHHDILTTSRGMAKYAVDLVPELARL